MGLAVAPTAALAEPEQAYLTADPASPDRLGLDTQEGWFSIQLGDGCDGFTAGENVLVDGDNLQMIDPLQGVQDEVCTVLDRVKLSGQRCQTNPDGVCDVAYG
jgi:hypothetical protein